MQMIHLERSKLLDHPWVKKLGGSFYVKKSPAYAKSLRGQYTHRVRHVILHESLTGSHLSISCWCGQTLYISKRKKSAFIDCPDQDHIICATCEGKAIGAGMDGERIINGRNVMYRPMRHIEGTK